MKRSSKHHSFTTRNPAYGPQGQPYQVVALVGEDSQWEWFWTRGEAEECRDRFLDAGFRSVRIVGLPTVASRG